MYFIITVGEQAAIMIQNIKDTVDIYDQAVKYAFNKHSADSLFCNK